MSDQLTQCPHCQTSFRVTQTQLEAAKGMVRCGSCLGLFSASINFIRVKPPLDTDSLDSEESTVTPVPLVSADDDVLLGDLNLDTEEPEDEPEDDELLAEDDFEDEDMASALQEAEEILLENPVPLEVRHYLTYEEYQDVPDLIDQLDLEDASAGNASTPETAVVPEYEPYIASDNEGGAQLELDEEFHPADFSAEDDDEDEDEDDDQEDYPETDEESDEDEDEEAGEAQNTEALVEAEDVELDEFDSPELGSISLDELVGADLLDDEELDGEEFDAGYLDEEIAQTDDDIDDAGEAAEPAEEDAETSGEELDEDEADAADIFMEFNDEFQDEFADLEDEDRLDTRIEPDTASRAAKPAWLNQPGTHTEDKALIHDYLATLDDEDDLEALEPAHLDRLEAEPLMLAGGRSKRGFVSSAALFLISLLLLATLLLQFVDEHLEQLSQRNSFAPYKPLFCRILDCPVVEDTATASTLYSQELLIRTHPRISSALELSFIFRNDEAAPQQFPGLELSFKDIDNRLLANRLFLPAEYLPEELQQLDQMPARSSVQVMLELADPGEKAVNYTIAFREL